MNKKKIIKAAKSVCFVLGSAFFLAGCRNADDTGQNSDKMTRPDTDKPMPHLTDPAKELSGSYKGTTNMRMDVSMPLLRYKDKIFTVKDAGGLSPAQCRFQSITILYLRQNYNMRMTAIL